MKKTLIALALTTISTASMAEVVLYGQIKGGVEVTKIKGVDGTTTAIVDYGSKIGFKGQEQLNGNLKAIWQLEQQVDVAGGALGKNKVQGFGTRDSFVGLAGDFGTVKAGYQSTPVKELNDKLDQWEYFSDYAGLGKFTRDNDAVRRAVAVTYETPNFGGFTGKVYVSPSDNNTEAVVVDANGNQTAKTTDKATYGLSASYENNGIFADVAGVYVHQGDNNPYKTTGKGRGYQALAQGGYNTDKWMAAVAYQYSHDVDQDFDRAHEVALSGAYNVDDALRLKASAAVGLGLKAHGANQNVKAYGNGKYYQGIIGADYALSKRTVVNGQIGYLQLGRKEYNQRGGALSVGLSHKF